MLTAKQGGIKYYFLSLSYDWTWDWTPVSQAIGEHSNHCANNLPQKFYLIYQPLHLGRIWHKISF